jgi:hypothetical protein
MSFGILGFLQDHTATETPAQALARQALQAAERADRQAAQDEADQAAAREEADEARAFRFRALNVQPGAVLARAQQEQEEDFEYDACRAQMERIERRRASRRRAAEAQAAQLEAATRASGQPAGIDHANELAARLRVEAMLAGPARARRPFASRSSVPGADDPVMCPGCAAVGASAIESFRIHHEDLGPVPDDFTEADLNRFPYQETGRARQSAGVICR